MKAAESGTFYNYISPLPFLYNMVQLIVPKMGWMKLTCWGKCVTDNIQKIWDGWMEMIYGIIQH